MAEKIIPQVREKNTRRRVRGQFQLRVHDTRKNPTLSMITYLKI